MRLILSLVLACLALPAWAHEFWIAPKAYMVEPGDVIEAHLRNGEMFKGGAFSYLPRKFRRFDVIRDGVARPVEGRPGDMPAVTMPAGEAGLLTLVHVTTDSFITYKKWEKFESFLRHKDAAWVLEEHAARGLGQDEVRERYSRYVKSLIAVGDGAGSDAAAGLETEIVALANPYTDDLSSGLPVRVLYQGAIRPAAQVELFVRAPDGSVTVSTHRADADGVALLPVKPGHEYLADHVVLRPLDPDAEDSDGATWESLWAALTFKVPVR